MTFLAFRFPHGTFSVMRNRGPTRGGYNKTACASGGVPPGGVGTGRPWWKKRFLLEPWHPFPLSTTPLLPSHLSLALPAYGKGREWIGVLRTRILRGSGNLVTRPETSQEGMSLNRFRELHPVPVKGWPAVAPAQLSPRVQIVQLQEGPRCPWCPWCGCVGFVRG